VSGSRVRCHRCGVPVAVVDWSVTVAPMVADRIVAAHAVECIPPRPRPLCKEPDCWAPVSARGWCKAHWTRWRRHGNPRALADNRGRIALEPLPDAPLKVVPPEPAVEVRWGVRPAVCTDCGKPYAADAALPGPLLAVARMEHKRRCGRAA